MVDEDDASSTLKPKLLQNRTFSSSITDAALCPGMDLVALVLDSKTIVVHRCTNWQRLAMFVPADTGIVSIAWSPDGALLAVALDNATVSLYAVDSSVRHHAASKDSSTAIDTVSLASNPTAVCWDIVRNDDGKENNLWEEAYAQRPYPPLRNNNNTSQVTSDDKRKHAVLVLGDADGCVSFYGFDLRFAIGKTRVFEPGVRVECVYIAKQSVIAIGSSEESDVLFATAIQLARFHGLHAEIWRVGAEVVALTDIREQLVRDVKHISTRWEACVKSSMLRSIEYPMEDALANVKDGVNVWDALCDAHHSAILHPAVATCLAAEIGEGGVREALRTFRGGQDDVEETLLKVCGLVENLLFRTSEYRGLAAVSANFARVGVDIAAIENAVSGAGVLMEQVGDLIAVLYSVCVETEWFLEWLIVQAQRADKDPEEAFKVRNLPTEPLETVSRFFERVLADKQACRKDVFSRTLEKFMDADTNKQENIDSKLNGMLASLNEMIAHPFDAISGTLFLDTRAVALSVPAQSGMTSARKASIMEYPQDGYLDVCTVQGAGRVAVLRFSPSEEQWKGCWIDVGLKSQENLLSWAHYKQMFLAVTADTPATDDAGVCALKLKVWSGAGFAGAKWVGLQQAKHGVEVLECEPTPCNELQVAFEVNLAAPAKSASLDVCGKNASIIVHPQRSFLLSLESGQHHEKSKPEF